MTIDKYQLDWTQVEKALDEGTFSGYKVAVIETDKILNSLLKNKKIPGQTTEKRIKNVVPFLSSPERFIYAQSMYRKIIEEPGFDISPEDTKNIIASYYQTIIDIIQTHEKELRFQERINLKLKGWLSSLPKIGKALRK